MDNELKKALLKNVYTVYDKFAGEITRVCKPGCASCCTRNVSLTTIEALHIMEWLSENRKLDMLGRLDGITLDTLSRPAVTTNDLAEKCLNHIEPPEDEVPVVSDSCPFLNRTDKTCVIYEARPFNCRSFFSETRCDNLGHAGIDPLLLTINNTFCQVIEHIDLDGLYGNMIEMLVLLEDKDLVTKYVNGDVLESRTGFLRARRIPGFIIPPEHEYKTFYLLNTLYDTFVGETTFREIIMEGAG